MRRLPISTAIWFAVWWLAVGWFLHARSNQAPFVRFEPPPTPAPTPAPPGPSPRPTPDVDTPKPTPKPDPSQPVGLEKLPAAGLSNALPSLEVVQAIRVFLTDTARAAGELGAKLPDVTARREAILAKTRLIGDARAAGKLPAEAGAAAFRRIDDAGALNEVPVEFTLTAFFRDGAYLTNPRSHAESLMAHLDSRNARNQRIPVTLFEQAILFARSVQCHLEYLDAFNRDVDEVLAALNAAGLNVQLLTDRPPLPDAPAGVIVAEPRPKSRARDPVRPPGPFPFTVYSDAANGIVLAPRTELKANPIVPADPKNTPEQIASRLRKRPDWSVNTLLKTRHQPCSVSASLQANLVTGVDYFTVTFTWQLSQQLGGELDTAHRILDRMIQMVSSGELPMSESASLEEAIAMLMKQCLSTMRFRQLIAEDKEQQLPAEASRCLWDGLQRAQIYGIFIVELNPLTVKRDPMGQFNATLQRDAGKSEEQRQREFQDLFKDMLQKNAGKSVEQRQRELEDMFKNPRRKLDETHGPASAPPAPAQTEVPDFLEVADRLFPYTDRELARMPPEARAVVTQAREKRK